MLRDSTRTLIRLLLKDEEAAKKWHSKPVRAHIEAELTQPNNLDEIVSIAKAHWPAVSTFVAEAGPSIVGALWPVNDHMISNYVEATFPSGVAYAPALLDGMVIWSQTDTLRIWWALIPNCE